MENTVNRGVNPTIIDIEPKKIRLTDFMKALGQEFPVAADGVLRIYKAPYDDHKPTLVINIESNLWRDSATGAHGDIYDLAYEITGSVNIRELKLYIAGEMQGYKEHHINEMNAKQNNNRSTSVKFSR